jgi:hypothetical protein
MNDLEISKNLLTGIFAKSHKLCEIDDSIFIQLIRAGIEEAGKNDINIYKELLDHAIGIYIDEWIEYALKDEERSDLDIEASKAKKAFLKYFSRRL